MSKPTKKRCSSKSKKEPIRTNFQMHGPSMDVMSVHFGEGKVGVGVLDGHDPSMKILVLADLFDSEEGLGSKQMHDLKNIVDRIRAFLCFNNIESVDLVIEQLTKLRGALEVSAPKKESADA